MRTNRGFTLIELVMVIVILGVLAAVAIPKFIDMGSDARIATLNGLEGSVKTTMETVKAVVALRGTTAAADPALNFLDMQGSTIRLWNGYPDRWWDGIGMTLQGATAIAGGGYLSSAPITFNAFTFYGYSNGVIPGGDAGWVLSGAPDKANCSLAYNYNGSAEPQLILRTTGC
jgi:MSHA pilin protein MshA